MFNVKVYYNEDSNKVMVSVEGNPSRYFDRSFSSSSDRCYDELHTDSERQRNLAMILYDEVWTDDDDVEHYYVEAYLPSVFNEWVPVEDHTNDGVDIVEFINQFKDVECYATKDLNRFVLVPDLSDF